MMSTAPDYEERAKNYGFAPQLDVLAALGRSDTVVLDVRREDEIAETGKIPATNWKQTACTPDACPHLAADPTQFGGPNKDAPIVIYCRSGRRAVAAQELLEKSGYKHVMNAGGYDDVMQLLKWQQRENCASK